MNKSSKKNTFGTYEDLASEYYDSIRHPTCANFREGSKIILSKFLDDFSLENRKLCEVGAGKSLIAELLENTNVSPNCFFITDLSFSMLAYSKQWNSHGAFLVVADAIKLPFPSNSMEIVISSLGDPYNTSLLWVEIFRILEPNGTFLFTTPSYEWATSFRRKDSGEAFRLAEFELSNGKHIWVPSWIYSINEQLKRIKKEGFFSQGVISVPLSRLKGKRISPKLLNKNGSDINVVTGYVLSKA